MESEEWCVAVFKCRSDCIQNVLVDFYDFVKDLEDVQSLHFLIRDRVGGHVVFSFRILVDSKSRSVVESKIAYKLGTLLPSKDFAVNPKAGDSLSKYAAWSPEERIAKLGQKKFLQFCESLRRFSRQVVWLVKNKYFGSDERVELAHDISSMLGCTEYGLLSTEQWEVGYYDRIENRYCTYLRNEFPKK